MSTVSVQREFCGSSEKAECEWELLFVDLSYNDLWCSGVHLIIHTLILEDCSADKDGQRRGED